jgi:predicted TIM-barrel fold metal-dependent hydrolase
MQVIDCDTHCFETAETWDYIDPAMRANRPQAATAEVAEGRQRKLWLVDGRQVGRGGNDSPGVTPAMRELRDIPARIRHMDEMGVDTQVIYPSFFLHAVTQRPDVEVALCRAYNRWMGEVTSGYRERLRWVVVPPLLDIDAALVEIEEAKKNGAVGIFMRGFEGSYYLFDPYFDRFYAKAQELDLAICVHAGQGNPVVGDIQAKNFFMMLVLPIISAAQQLLIGGVPQKFPGLRFGFFEAGSNWVPFVLQQARKSATARGKYPWPENPIPDSRFYVCCESDDDLGYVTNFTGPSNLVIGTDYGHTDNAAEIDALKKLRDRAPVAPQVIDDILGANAQVLYAL